jgi:glucan biosynthesis protein C
MYYNIYLKGLSWDEAWKSSFTRMFRLNGVYHLWFLYDLLIYYTFTVIATRINRISFVGNLTMQFSLWWSKVSFSKKYWPIILTVPVWFILFFDKDLFVFVDVQFIPKHISYILFYGYFFGLGWLLEKRSDVFAVLIKNRTLFICIGTIVSLFLFYAEWNSEIYHQTSLWHLAKFAAAFQITILSLGFIGFFLHYFKAESYFWRYVSDASYWVYLTHLGLVVWLQLLFLDSKIPGIFRFPLVLGITMLITFATYQWFVRYTFIGNILHGPRKRKKDH